MGATCLVSYLASWTDSLAGRSKQSESAVFRIIIKCRMMMMMMMITWLTSQRERRREKPCTSGLIGHFVVTDKSLAWFEQCAPERFGFRLMDSSRAGECLPAFFVLPASSKRKRKCRSKANESKRTERQRSKWTTNSKVFAFCSSPLLLSLLSLLFIHQDCEGGFLVWLQMETRLERDEMLPSAGSEPSNKKRLGSGGVKRKERKERKEKKRQSLVGWVKG